MDRRFAVTALAVLAVTVGAGALASRVDPADTAPIQENVSGVEREPEPERLESEAEAEEPEYAYVIKEYEGRVAVFSADEPDTPKTVLNTLVRYLPDYDQQQMQQGIPVKDYQELVSLIEDYVS